VDVQTWLAFVSASAVRRVIPGPAILRVASYGPGRGWRAARPTAVGVAPGDFTAMALSMPGIGVLPATSASIFACSSAPGRPD
jgi:threonine/homoserine/homoserine lactone efflux protein